MFLFIIMINAGRDNAEKQKQLEQRKKDQEYQKLLEEIEADEREWEQKIQRWKEEEKIFSEAVRNNNEGRELERQGKIDEAIKCYEASIATGKLTIVPHERLRIVYRKRKDKENEIMVLKRAVAMFEEQLNKMPQNQKIIDDWKAMMQKLGVDVERKPLRVILSDSDKESIQRTINRFNQIINESIAIISRTKNLDTIEQRMNLIRDSWDSLLNYSIPNQPNFLKEFEQEYNQQIVRAVNELYNDYILKIESLKTARAKENHTVRMFETIEKAKSILIDNETYQHSLQRLEEIHHNTEETFSSIST